MWLAVLLTVSAASSTGLSLAGVGTAITRDITSVPGLAQALARQKVTHPQRHTPIVSVAIAGATNTLPLGAQNIAPGQSITREVIIRNTGNTTFQALTVRVQAKHPSPIIGYLGQGLFLSLTTCSACTPFVRSPIATLLGRSIATAITLRPGRTLRLVAVFSLPVGSTLSGEQATLYFSGVLSA